MMPPNSDLYDPLKFRIWFAILFPLLLIIFPIKGETNVDEEKWIRKGRIFYEFGLAYETVSNPSYQTNAYARNYYRYLLPEDTSLALVGLSGIGQAQKQADLSGNNQKISLEYSLNDWIGIGGSLQNSLITTYNLTKNDTELVNSKYNDLQLATLFVPEFKLLSDAFNLYGLLPEKKQTQFLRTYDYDITFHLPNQGNFDPYFRISLGRGFLTEDLVGRTGWSSGIKWRLDPTLYVNMDVYQSRLISKSKSGDVDNYIETGIRFGAGFYSTWPK